MYNLNYAMQFKKNKNKQTNIDKNSYTGHYSDPPFVGEGVEMILCDNREVRH